MLGLAQRAGKLVSGDDIVQRHLKLSRPHLLILATDASQRTKQELYRVAEAHACRHVEYGTKAQLGSAIGKPDRAVLLLEDQGFIDRVLSLMGDRE